MRFGLNLKLKEKRNTIVSSCKQSRRDKAHVRNRLSATGMSEKENLPVINMTNDLVGKAEQDI